MKKKLKAFSLLETVVTLAIFGILMAMLSQVLILNLNAAKTISQRSQVRDEVSQIVGLMQRDLRNADNVYLCETSQYGVSSCNVVVDSQPFFWVNNEGESEAIIACKNAAGTGRQAICKIDNNNNVLFVSSEIINVKSLRFDSNVIDGRGQVLATIEIEASNEAWDVRSQVRQISVSTRNF